MSMTTRSPPSATSLGEDLSLGGVSSALGLADPFFLFRLTDEVESPDFLFPLLQKKGFHTGFFERGGGGGGAI